MQSDPEFEIIKIVLDKGLLAILVAVFAWVLARSIERLKASLSWNGELLKQRMDTVKRILKEMRELEHTHLQVIGELLIEGTGTDPRKLFDVIKNIEGLRIELGILQAKPSVLEAIDHVLKLTGDVVGAQPPGTPGRLIEGEDGSLSLEQASAERAEWMRQRMEQVSEAITTAIRNFENTIADGFPIR